MFTGYVKFPGHSRCFAVWFCSCPFSSICNWNYICSAKCSQFPDHSQFSVVLLCLYSFSIPCNWNYICSAKCSQTVLSSQVTRRVQVCDCSSVDCSSVLLPPTHRHNDFPWHVMIDFEGRMEGWDMRKNMWDYFQHRPSHPSQTDIPRIRQGLLGAQVSARCFRCLVVLVDGFTIWLHRAFLWCLHVEQLIVHSFPLPPFLVRHMHAQTPTLQPQNPWLSHFLTLRPSLWASLSGTFLLEGRML